jgi:protein-disulfide isomerase
VYRDFPLHSVHPQAGKAAEAAQCAFEQDGFWGYHDLLFEKQNDWSGVGVSKFKEYAVDLDLDSAQFDDCLDSGKYRSEVEADLQEGQHFGVTGTPGFIVFAPKTLANVDALKQMHNGQNLIYSESNGGMNVLFKISGAQPFSIFQQVIEASLAKTE